MWQKLTARGLAPRLSPKRAANESPRPATKERGEGQGEGQGEGLVYLLILIMETPSGGTPNVQPQVQGRHCGLEALGGVIPA